MKRLFLAIKLPKKLVSDLAEIQQLLRERLSPKAVKWVERENLHLTLTFLGDQKETIIPILSDILNCVARENHRLTLKLSELGAFPDSENPKVIWIGCRGELEQLGRLHSDILSSLKELKIYVDQKFSAHITLGRVKEGEFASIPSSEHINQIIQKSQPFFVSSFSLMESLLLKWEPHYNTICKLLLSK